MALFLQASRLQNTPSVKSIKNLPRSDQWSLRGGCYGGLRESLLDRIGPYSRLGEVGGDELLSTVTVRRSVISATGLARMPAACANLGLRFIVDSSSQVRFRAGIGRWTVRFQMYHALEYEQVCAMYSPKTPYAPASPYPPHLLLQSCQAHQGIRSGSVSLQLLLLTQSWSTLVHVILPHCMQ
jgi:hypothetical protein